MASRVGLYAKYFISTLWPDLNTRAKISDPNWVLAGQEPDSNSMTRLDATSLIKYSSRITMLISNIRVDLESWYRFSTQRSIYELLTTKSQIKNIVYYNIKKICIEFIKINKNRKLSIILILILILILTIIDSIILFNSTRNL